MKYLFDLCRYALRVLNFRQIGEYESVEDDYRICTLSHLEKIEELWKHFAIPLLVTKNIFWAAVKISRKYNWNNAWYRTGCQSHVTAPYGNNGIVIIRTVPGDMAHNNASSLGKTAFSPIQSQSRRAIVLCLSFHPQCFHFPLLCLPWLECGALFLSLETLFRSSILDVAFVALNFCLNSFSSPLVLAALVPTSCLSIIISLFSLY